MTRRDRRALTLAVVASLAGCALIGVIDTSGGGGVAADAATATTIPTPTTTPNSEVAPAGIVQPTATDAVVPTAASTIATVTGDGSGLRDLDGGEATSGTGCRLHERSIRAGSTGNDVICLQQALADAGLYSGTVSGSFDGTTDAAVRRLQEERNLFVDGVVGRESGIALGIWPDEASLVVHTPAPRAGAVDLMGYPLSSVASAGDNAPPLPENSGSGRRLVYDRAGQRVWAVGDNGQIIRSWLVSGSKYGNEAPGTHEVYSRSDVTTAWNGKAYLHLMVRWLKTERGAIGFHSIPLHVENGQPYQTEAELGNRLSGGCQRQAPADARFVWAFAQIGTPVIVI